MLLTQHLLVPAALLSLLRGGFCSICHSQEEVLLYLKQHLCAIQYLQITKFAKDTFRMLPKLRWG